MVDTVPVSDFIQTNAYFYIDEQTKHGFLIDPGAEAEKLLNVIIENGWIIEKILITHGHFDHIGGVDEISQKLNIPYLAHKNSQNYLTDGNYNLSAFFVNEIKLNNALYVDEGQNIVLEANPAVKLRVIYTPGHTQDAVIYYDANNKLAFVGDTIFKNTVGRTDIPGGNEQQLYQSIREKIFTLPDDTVLYPGHSEPTTVGAEKP
ncbi:MAG: MBL fold metallo-hydrolase [Alphaproteobacteria bacterium]|nr:MBL fold metallo-hydrolase [Alphaproteobacteria bacterium]